MQKQMLVEERECLLLSFGFFPLLGPSCSFFLRLTTKKSLMINEFLLLYSHRRAAHTYHTIQKEKKKERTSFRVRAKKKRKNERKKAGNLFSCPNRRYVVLSNSHLSLSNRVYAGVFIDSLVKTKKDK
jgi:hypothetical protein